MSADRPLDAVAIGYRSHRLLRQLLAENPRLSRILFGAQELREVRAGVRQWVEAELEQRPQARAFHRGASRNRAAFERLSWRDYATIRLMDYLDHAGMELPDPNLRGELSVSEPFRVLWLAATRGTGGAQDGFFEDLLHLFRQFTGRERRQRPDREQVERWMERWPSGLDARMVWLREENRRRILGRVIDAIDRGEVYHRRYCFEPGMSRAEKRERAALWWNDHRFHLRFAVRSPDLLDEMLGNTLAPETMATLHAAEAAGIPFFVNPYYLSLLNVRTPAFAAGADAAIRQYVLYSRELVEEFGRIHAWEKEDEVEPGVPNAAGWLLPSASAVHRRYPEVAILIPESMGRACGGLCAPCQRMYEFQRGNLNFNLDRLRTRKDWWSRFEELLSYWETDSQLRDVLITGGDALMSSDRTLARMLDGVLEMARRKRAANRDRPDGGKYAEIQRVRLGTRLPVYLPMRITDHLQHVLSRFRRRAREVGLQQFVIQTHFETAAEVTPAVRAAVRKLHAAGWIVTNQLVLTTAAARRGHTARLRQVLNDIGVLPYYTFSVKGFMENRAAFASNARSMQEQAEEKVFGRIPPAYDERIKHFSDDARCIVEEIDSLREVADLPFLATDRNVLNMPGVGKSNTFRVVGITRYGRRILEFDHDRTRRHSPIIEHLGKVTVIESRTVSELLAELEALGEDPAEYTSIWGYSLGETEHLAPIYRYPDHDVEVTDEVTNLALPEAAARADRQTA